MQECRVSNIFELIDLKLAMLSSLRKKTYTLFYLSHLSLIEHLVRLWGFVDMETWNFAVIYFGGHLECCQFWVGPGQKISYSGDLSPVAHQLHGRYRMLCGVFGKLQKESQNAGPQGFGTAMPSLAEDSNALEQLPECSGRELALDSGTPSNCKTALDHDNLDIIRPINL